MGAALAWCAVQLSPVHAQAGAACRPDGSVQEVNACALSDFQAADTEISVLYQDVMRALAAHERPQLRREQQAWNAERTRQCKQATQAVEQQADGPRRYHECMTEKTRARRGGLMRWLSAQTPAQP